jgi:hypothetical protein
MIFVKSFSAEGGTTSGTCFLRAEADAKSVIPKNIPPKSTKNNGIIKSSVK